MFIVIEGIDEAGKSTQTRLLKEKLPDAISLREPGGTTIGEKIRGLLLEGQDDMDNRTEVLLFMAARAELHHEIILPALAAGKDVILDRWAWSTLAYQGVNIPFTKLMPLVEFATFGKFPDCTILIDLEPEIALKRRTPGIVIDRIEQRALDYHKKVRANYLELAQQYRMIVIDGTKSIEEIHELILKECGH